jgi:hypothetical protein
MTRRMFGRFAFSVALMIGVSPHGPAHAADVGQPAPDFKLPSTMGGDVALSDYRGKKWVLLEFYGADFSPT